jgi:hypothetical protein
MSRRDLNVATPRSGFAILMLIVVICAAIVMAACGGDDEEKDLSQVGSYLTQLSAVITLNNFQLQGLEEQYPTAFNEVDPTKEYYTNYVETLDRFLDVAKQLPVPAEVGDAHDEYIASSEAVSEINQTRRDELARATTIDEVNTIFAEDPAYTAAVDRLKAACRALVSIAAANEVLAPGLGDCNNFN